MPPKNMKVENAVFYTADGRKIGRIEDFETEAPVWEHDSEIIGKVQRMDAVEGTFAVDITETGKRLIKQLETEVAIVWAYDFSFARLSHLARFGKNRRIRKKNADACRRHFEKWQRGGKDRGYKVY